MWASTEPPEALGVVCERVGLSREEDIAKVLNDPKLPSKRDVEMHYLMNHLHFRNWCLLIKFGKRNLQCHGVKTWNPMSIWVPLYS